MKRLLAEGLPAIYQVTRSFRRGERGALHNPEFTIVEWYRAGDDMDAGIAAARRSVPTRRRRAAAVRTTYADAFLQHAGVDPHRATCDDLAAAAVATWRRRPETACDTRRPRRVAQPAPGDARRAAARRRGPGDSARLSGEPVGARRDGRPRRRRRSRRALRALLARRRAGQRLPRADRRRGAAAPTRSGQSRRRAADGRPALPLPERLLAAMESPGLPPCCGCALGFDRLVMLACGADDDRRRDRVSLAVQARASAASPPACAGSSRRVVVHHAVACMWA